MQISLFAAFALALGLSACAPPPERPAAEETATPAEAATPATVSSRGIVVTVTREHGAITIQHEAIPEYGMGAMTMEFTVADAASLEGIQPGDSVRFELSGPLDIASLSKIE